MQFNQIPTTSYAMQQRDGGMISQGRVREVIQTLELIALIHVLIGEPSSSQLPFLFPALNHSILSEFG